MVHEFTQVRAGVLRTLRYTLKTSRDIQIFNELQLPLLVCRSIDIVSDNEEERVQAFKLVNHHDNAQMFKILSENAILFYFICRYEKSYR